MAAGGERWKPSPPAALAALVALSLLLGLAFDYPFTGDVKISALPFDEALEQMPPTWPPP